MDEKVFHSLNSVHHASLFLLRKTKWCCLVTFHSARVILSRIQGHAGPFSADDLLSDRHTHHAALQALDLHALSETTMRFLSKNPPWPQGGSHRPPLGRSGRGDRTASAQHSAFDGIAVETQMAVATDVPMSDKTQATYLGRFSPQPAAFDRPSGLSPSCSSPTWCVTEERRQRMAAMAEVRDLYCRRQPRAHTSKKAYTPLTDEELATVLREPWPVWPSHAVLSVHPLQLKLMTHRISNVHRRQYNVLWLMEHFLHPSGYARREWPWANGLDNTQRTTRPSARVPTPPPSLSWTAPTSEFVRFFRNTSHPVVLKNVVQLATL